MNDIENPNDIARFIYVDVANAFIDRYQELIEYGFQEVDARKIIDAAKAQFMFLCDDRLLPKIKHEPRIMNDAWITNLMRSNNGKGLKEK